MGRGKSSEAAGHCRKKKKGRPSLLDLHRRSLRLEKLHHVPDSAPLTNSNTSSGRRGAPGKHNHSPPDEEDDEDEDGGGKRREKKLRLVLDSRAQESGKHGSEKEVDLDTVEGGNTGPTTHLPNEKLLVFILDRLQKKDTYGVFSEPVDPDELPDYHEIIKHPMDFGTVREKLSSAAYKNLEQFEEDIFLISSNAMRYNAPDTIYYRQARAIEQLAKKDFENLRQASDDDETETKYTSKGGRLPPHSKTIAKATVVKPPADRASSDFSSNATVANSANGPYRSSTDFPIKGASEISTKASNNLYCTESSSCIIAEQKLERSEEHSGSVLKGSLMKFAKKLPGVNESRRNTYKQSSKFTCLWDQPVLATFERHKKLLVPVGFHVEYAYARSLARFAAKLGPIGWEIAAKRIKRALPPGTSFEQGWVGDNKAHQRQQVPLVPSSVPHSPSSTGASSCTTISRDVKLPQSPEVASSGLEDLCAARVLPHGSSPAGPNTSDYPTSEPPRISSGSRMNPSSK